MKKSLYIILVSTLLLGSCATYKKYERPNVKTSELFRDTANENSFLASTDTVSLGSMPWRQVFTDGNLQQLIDSGLKNNTDLLTATLSVTQAKAMLQAAKLAFYPSFVFAPSGTAALWNFDKGASSYSMPIEANWTVDLFGSLTNAKRAQQVALLQSQDYQRAVQSGIIANIANAYYTLLMLDKQMEITKNTEQLTKQTYDMMVQQKQYSAGVDESAVQSAKANYYSVLASIPELERQIRSTENSLSILLGEAPRHILRSKLENQSLPSNLSTGVGIQLLANRPDVHAKEMALANCFYQVNKARAAFYPSLTINGSAAWTNNSGAGIINPGKILASAVGSLVQPIFQKGQLKAQLKVTQAQEQSAFLAWQQSILTAGSEVSNALALYQSSWKRSELEKTQIESLQRNVDVAQKLFKMGSNYNYLNVISAQRSLLQAQLSQISDDFNKMQAVVNLYYALGGGSK
jgi:NodT family efflux transporter outer membrane factor (OMF) lipoprotein